MKKELCVVVFLSFVFFVSCNNNPSGSVSEDALIGKWTFTKEVVNVNITASGMSMKMDTTIVFSGNNDYVEFKNDHTYYLTIDEDLELMKKKIGKDKEIMMGEATTETGTWSLSGNSLKIISDVGDTTTFTVSINGSNATFTQNVDEKDPILGTEVNGTMTLHGKK
ncbi:MAG: hypothetical protein N2053_02365 [Chitinispirillaceae bacterium]|nr:hypothetical protein [Chitinispirillaceae bacterium]